MNCERMRTSELGPGTALDARAGFLKVFVFLVAWLVASGWGLSLVGRLQWAGFSAVIGLAIGVWMARRLAGSWSALVQQAGEPFASPVILVVSGFILAGALAYPPTMLDSLTYRLPRILLWLEAGRVYHIEAAEPRLNYLCHGWELCTAPVVILLGLRFTWVWNFLSWVACHVLYYQWALELGQTRPRARWMALLANTSTFAVLQASGTANDLMAASLLLLSLDFIRGFERLQRPSAIYWAGLSFCLSTAVKPHFAVMGLPLVLWFVLARSQPWRHCPWRMAPLLLPLMVLCSAVPTFTLNKVSYGNVAGPASAETYTGAGPLSNVACGSVMMAWQAVQPCVNPPAFLLNDRLETLVQESGIRRITPRFHLHMAPVNLASNASFGSVTSAVLLAGWIIALRRVKGSLRQMPGLALLAGVFGFAAAVSQFLPGAVGRSFLGFWLLGVPLAMEGWRFCSGRLLHVAAITCAFGALLAVIMIPSRPLWPVGWVQAKLVSTGRDEVVDKLESYLSMQDRARCGRGLADKIPEGTPLFVALIAEDRPLLPVLASRHGPGAVRLLPSGAAPEDLLSTGTRYVILCDQYRETYAELVEFLESSGSFEEVDRESHLATLRRGPEAWILYRRKTVPDPGT